MKKRWVTADEAAELANRSTRTIWHWSKRYGLTKRPSGNNHTLFDAVEVNAIVDAENREFAPTTQMLAVLAARLHKVETELEVLSYTAGRYRPIDTTPAEARTLYETTEIFARDEVPPEMIEECVGFLNGVSEELFDQLMEQDILHPWVPFFTLAANLQSQLRNSNHFATDLDKQLLYRQLSVARERLRGIALIYIEMDLRSEARQALSRYVGDAPMLESELRRRMLWKKDVPTKRDVKAPSDLIEDALALLQSSETLQAKRKAVALLRSAVRGIESEKIENLMG
ncbi:MAG: hypothetical protein KDB07_03170 [Planctomycetes bacterium]|nr:hypothetical protein [Planctomycetota bacterium]